MSPAALAPLLHAIAQLQPVEEAQRVFHGRGDLHPGCEHLSLDAYPPVWLLTTYASLSEEALTAIQQAFNDRWAALSATVAAPALTWVLQERHLPGAPTRLMCGTVPEPHTVTEGGLRYGVQLPKGQNHGLFLDMAEGRRWVFNHAQNHPNLRVLNLFAYTCAFSVAALAGGAQHVVNVDMSSSALAQGQRNHALNGLQGRASFWAHDLFNSWGKIGRSGPYDLIIADPPSYQKGSFVATKDYARLIKRLPDLLTPGGHALLCLNAPELSSQFLEEQVHQNAPKLQWLQRLENPISFIDIDPNRALKALIYQQSE